MKADPPARYGRQDEGGPQLPLLSWIHEKIENIFWTNLTHFDGTTRIRLLKKIHFSNVLPTVKGILMHRSTLNRFGLALIVALALVGVLALAAQAVDLTDGGKEGSFSIEPTIGTFAATALDSTLLIASKNAYVLCETSESIEARGLSPTEILAKVRFSGCAAFNDTTKAVLSVCPVEGENSLGEKGTIDASAIGKAKLHEGKLFVLFEGDGGAPFATIKFGPECGIGVKVKVSGSVAAEVDDGEMKSEHLLTFSEAIQKLLGTKVLYGAAESFISGLAHVKTSGTYAGYRWAVG